MPHRISNPPVEVVTGAGDKGSPPSAVHLDAQVQRYVYVTRISTSQHRAVLLSDLDEKEAARPGPTACGGDHLAARHCAATLRN